MAIPDLDPQEPPTVCQRQSAADSLPRVGRLLPLTTHYKRIHNCNYCVSTQKKISCLCRRIVLLVILTVLFCNDAEAKFTQRPQNTTFNEGEQVMLNCSVIFLHENTIDWKCDIGFTGDYEVVYTSNSGSRKVGLTVIHPNNSTYNLVIFDPKDGICCCQTRNGEGEEACAYLVQAPDVPQNVVVLAGMERTLQCTHGEPYRWYTYQLDKPTEAKVIYRGSTYASHVNQSHFRVYKESTEEPYKRLDLRIKDVQASDAGTYKCMQLHSSLCAELIVLASEPRCVVKQLYNANEMVALQCDIIVTENGEPQMDCIHESGSSTKATCSTSSNGVVSCVSMVPAMSHANYTCSIKINSKPKQNLSSCTQAKNIPQYSYKWTPSEVTRQIYSQAYAEIESGERTTKESMLLVILATSVLVNMIVFLAVIMFCIVKRRKDGICQKHCSKPSPESPPPPEYTSLAFPALAYCSVTARAPGLIAPAPEYSSITQPAPEYSSLIHPPASTYEEIVDLYGTANPERIASPYATHAL